jgi:hypothetical protein
MPQNTLGNLGYIYRPGGNNWSQVSVLGTALAPVGSLIKATPGTLMRVSIIVAGTTSGALTFNDANAYVTAQTITAITAANPAVVTVSTGGSTNPFAVGNTIAFTSAGGMTQINAVYGQVTAIGGVTTAWTITTNINASAFTAYTSGGTCASFSQANEFYSILESSATQNLAGYTGTVEWPCYQGILASAVMGGALVANVSWN